jgi:hypothetical protein|tara:strand:- start:483 stop:815 length:333 start_codon:yes stop_codon:yes gene_type:complete
MSGWVFGLGLGAAYMMKKKFDFQQSIDEKVTEYHSSVLPANPGPTTQAIRSVQGKADAHDKFQDINVTELTAADSQKLAALPEKMKAEVSSYEAGDPPVVGVWLNSRGAW